MEAPIKTIHGRSHRATSGETWLVGGDYFEERISLQVLVEVIACPYYTQSFTLRLAVSAFNVREGATGKGNSNQ